MNARCWLAAALLMCAACVLSPRAVAEDKKPDPKGIDKETAEAWEKRGFNAGWMRERGRTVWLASNYPKVTDGVVPVFWHRSFGRNVTDETLKELPPVAVPFALNLSGRNGVTDAGLKHLAGLNNLTWLTLGSAQVTGEGLKHLASLKNLTKLNLSGTKVTDASLKHLAEVNSLTALSLGNAEITDDGLKELTHLKNLTSLDLGGTRVTDAGLPHLAAFKNLSELHLDNTQVTDAGLEHLAGFKNLTTLNVWSTSVTGKNLMPLANLKNLNSLSLDRNKVTDQVLETLHEFGLLHALHQAEIYGGTQGHIVDGIRPTKPEEARSFNLNGTRVTGKGVKYLAGLKNLTNLYIDAPQVTPEGLKNLADLPNLIVLHLASTEVTGESLKPLAGLKNLTHLTMPITDETLKALHEAGLLHRLRRAKGADDNRPATPDEVVSLDLSETQVKGEGLKYVGKLKNLAALNLKNTQVTEAWIEDFQRTLPKCKIMR